MESLNSTEFRILNDKLHVLHIKYENRKQVMSVTNLVYV